ncbi:unnamed protein product [Bursaphelenchus xylophilus]|uniref:(pine wood nematode) hypothetical protein n=1 Tax=Bursaphelenchus xylophilus TaxID=6326 RepID=A0A1I7S5Y2_BURXY|nr:unnamed protein product [Bursaphelenchus xylophilus]CAG9082524.1 unnamed protein product [Bursaphelenchus xylophilus]
MYRAVLLALLTLSASARLHGLEKKVTINELELFNGFQNFTKTFDKNYASLEEAFQRYQVYKANQLRLQELQQSEQGTATYGETQFMDLTPEEFRTFYLSNITVDSIPMRKLTVEELKELKSDAPTSLDHRQNGFVTGVKDQGKCGACWAFSVVGNIEGLWKKKSGDLVRLSEQELVDCDRRDKGCQGGNMLVTYSEIIRLGGLVKEEDYPYKGRNERCNLERNQIVAKIDSFVHINQNEETIKQYLYEHGPISVGINANPLQYYSRGVFHPTSSRCSPRGLNHAVTLVGYGVDGKDPYWLVKNSWGTRWGENGYFRIYRGANVCGIAAFATSAVIN